MNIEGGKGALFDLTKRQLVSFFPLLGKDLDVLESRFDKVLEDVSYCFSLINNKYYKRGEEVYFDPMHTSQYGIYLYFYSKAVFEDEDVSRVSSALYILNKIINSVDLYYEINLPRHFFMDHPVGSVMGRAIYGEGFSFSQCCTVGNNKGSYPVIGENVRMMSGSSIIGRCNIGNNVIVSKGVTIKDVDVPNSVIVFEEKRKLIFKEVV